MNNYDGYILNKETINLLIKNCEYRILDLIYSSINRTGDIDEECKVKVKEEKIIIDRLEDSIREDYYIGDKCGENIKDLNIK